MARVPPTGLVEAEKLLKQVQSWSEAEVEDLPLFYERKAREYRLLSYQGIQTNGVNIEAADMFTLKDVQFLFHFADESVIIGKQTQNYASEIVF